MAQLIRSHTQYQERVFQGVELPRSQLVHSEFIECSFSDCSFAETTFGNCRLVHFQHQLLKIARLH